MGKVIVLPPFKPAEIVAHEGIVSLDDTRRLAACSVIDSRRLGSLGGGRYAYMWFDDEGLFNDAPANRQVGSQVIAGQIMICAVDETGDSLALTDDEAIVVMDVAQKWPILPEGTEKPEPKIEFISF